MKTIKKDFGCKKETEYPCLREGRESGIIYLMITERTGIVVHEGPTIPYKLGITENSLSNTKPFHGSICLEN